MSNQKTRSATERLGDLEQATMSVFQELDNRGRETQMIKEALKLLGNKVNAIVQLAEAGQSINNTAIAAQMVANSIQELVDKIDGLKAQGLIEAEEVVTADSLIVAREMNSKNEIVTARLQITVPGTPPEAQEKLVGAKPGDILELAGGNLKVEILESYKIVTPQAPQADVAPSQEASEAPAEQAASN